MRLLLIYGAHRSKNVIVIKTSFTPAAANIFHKIPLFLENVKYTAERN
jgi:hypothetical protein